jgi:hypothetical protein
MSVSYRWFVTQPRFFEFSASTSSVITSFQILPSLRAFLTSTTCYKQFSENKKTPWPESASELHWPSDRRLSKLMPTFADRGMSSSQRGGSRRAVISCFLDRSSFSFQVAPQSYSRDWVDPVPEPLLLWISGRAGNRTRTSRSVARNFDHIFWVYLYLYSPWRWPVC